MDNHFRGRYATVQPAGRARPRRISFGRENSHGQSALFVREVIVKFALPTMAKDLLYQRERNYVMVAVVELPFFRQPASQDPMQPETQNNLS